MVAFYNAGEVGNSMEYRTDLQPAFGRFPDSLVVIIPVYQINWLGFSV